MRAFKAAMIVTLALAGTAAAQEDGELADRLDRMERDLQLMQRQVYRGEAAPSRITPVDAGPSDDQMRAFNGRFEELEYKIRQLSERLDKIQKDNDLRLRDLEQKQTGAAIPAPAPTQPAPVEPTVVTEPEDAAKVKNLAEQKPVDPGEEKSSFQDSREHYNYAFRLLNQAKLDQAGASFEDFVKRYPKDPLIGNAYYWLGETYYARRDFANAANNFRIGYEQAQTGPKAPDNLLKLGMTLGTLGQNQEACVVLSQVKVKFPKGAASTVQKAETERTRLGCK
ncbi:MAG: tol-pal system protein YbgF [Alphaproteobacteria bacterium]|nr:tol-pal system protein YbgF [Alphaproteobacteria bacterium]